MVKKIELLKYPEGTQANRDGLHLPSVKGQDTETLCGIFMDGEQPEYVSEERPGCLHCINLVSELFHRYTKKQVKEW